jgi:hypothetical protein
MRRQLWVGWSRLLVIVEGGGGEGCCELSSLSSCLGEDEGERKRRGWNDANCERVGCTVVIGE